MNKAITVNLRQPQSYETFVAYASFDTEPQTNNRAIATNVEVTKQEFDSLFSTHKYERPYLPEYYNPLEEFLGELWTETTETFALNAVIEKVSEFIPHVVIDNNTRFTFKDYKIEMNLVFYYKHDFDRTLYSYKRQFDTVT